MTTTCTAFSKAKRVAAGAPETVALELKALLDAKDAGPILVFDDATGRPIDFDLRGTTAEILARLSPPEAAEPSSAPARGPGRPRLGVVSREITLMPRHWEWLNAQPGGASVALRKLVEAARGAHAGDDKRRRSREAADRVMSALAGNEPGYEEAARALYAGDRARFEQATAAWPAEVRAYGLQLAAAGFEGAGEQSPAVATVTPAGSGNQGLSRRI